jgi:hypothetical protein
MLAVLPRSEPRPDSLLQRAPVLLEEDIDRLLDEVQPSAPLMKMERSPTLYGEELDRLAESYGFGNARAWTAPELMVSDLPMKRRRRSATGSDCSLADQDRQKSRMTAGGFGRRCRAFLVRGRVASTVGNFHPTERSGLGRCMASEKVGQPEPVHRQNDPEALYIESLKLPGSIEAF